MKKKPTIDKHPDFSSTVGKALRRAARSARKTARAFGTPIYVMKNGKIIAEKP